MKSKKYLQLIILCLLVSFSVVLPAKAMTRETAVRWAEDKGNLLLSTFQEKDLAVKYQKLDELFLQYVDLDYIGRFVVGKYWRQMNEDQRQRYQEIFKRYALGTYKSFPLTFDTKITFDITNAVVSPQYTDVYAFIDLGVKDENGVPKRFNVMFRLTEKEGREPRLIDIKLAESSLILSYRNRFYEMIAASEDDIEWFLEDLATVTESTERTNQMALEQEKQ